MKSAMNELMQKIHEITGKQIVVIHYNACQWVNSGHFKTIEAALQYMLEMEMEEIK